MARASSSSSGGDVNPPVREIGTPRREAARAELKRSTSADAKPASPLSAVLVNVGMPDLCGSRSIGGLELPSVIADALDRCGPATGGTFVEALKAAQARGVSNDTLAADMRKAVCAAEDEADDRSGRALTPNRALNKAVRYLERSRDTPTPPAALALASAPGASADLAPIFKTGSTWATFDCAGSKLWVKGEDCALAFDNLPDDMHAKITVLDFAEAKQTMARQLSNDSAPTDAADVLRNILWLGVLNRRHGGALEGFCPGPYWFVPPARRWAIPLALAKEVTNIIGDRKFAEMIAEGEEYGSSSSYIAGLLLDEKPSFSPSPYQSNPSALRDATWAVAAMIETGKLKFCADNGAFQASVEDLWRRQALADRQSSPPSELEALCWAVGADGNLTRPLPASLRNGSKK